MPYGYNRKILRIDLSSGYIGKEEPEDNFYRRYIGGMGFVAYYLLKELKKGIDPLSPENLLIFAPGVLTGAPVGGCGRNSVGGKSPLTGAFGEAEAGGYWGAELKFAGWDGIVIQGKAEKPVYIWIKDEKVEIRDARHLWGLKTLDCQRSIREELGDPLIRVAQIGPAGEKLVRFACVINDIDAAAGRTGMGALMGSKKLKAIAVRGSNRLQLADPEMVKSLAKWLRDNVHSLARRLHELGTAGVVLILNREGGLPTRNFQQGTFENAEKISGEAMRNTILIGQRSCFACPIRCKREVKVEGIYNVNPQYGGPEYETIASFGSNCGIDNLPAIAKANEICNAYGLDTISCGATIAFAMECYERGILTKKDTDGLDLYFGNSSAMVELTQKIAQREGFGDILAEGVARAAQRIGRGAAEYALHIKGQEIPMHEPRYKQGMGLGYMLSSTGADHVHNIHDTYFATKSPYLEAYKSLGILEPLPLTDLSPAKVKMLIYFTQWTHLLNCLLLCYFVSFVFNPNQVVDLVRAVTGWDTSLWEMMKVGERVMTMARFFNIREGFSPKDDYIPSRFFIPFSSGPLKGVSIDKKKIEEAKEVYYAMMGWEGGKPSSWKLGELGIEWIEKEG